MATAPASATPMQGPWEVELRKRMPKGLLTKACFSALQSNYPMTSRRLRGCLRGISLRGLSATPLSLFDYLHIEQGATPLVLRNLLACKNLVPATFAQMLGFIGALAQSVDAEYSRFDAAAPVKVDNENILQACAIGDLPRTTQPAKIPGVIWAVNTDGYLKQPFVLDTGEHKGKVPAGMYVLGIRNLDK